MSSIVKFVLQNLSQVAILALLLGQNVSHALLISASRMTPTKYFSSTAVLMTELAKLLASIFALSIESFSLRPVWQLVTDSSSWSRSLVLIFPAAVYCFQNNLAFVALSYISASQFQLVVQFKTFTTAIFSVVFLRTKLNFVQWLALGLLVMGVILAQQPTCEPAINMAVAAATTMTPSLAPSPGMIKQPVFSLGNQAIGVGAALTMTVLSGAAGVYQEKVLKKAIDLPLHVLNAQLAVFSIILNGIAMYVMEGEELAAKGLFYGFTPLTWAVVLVSALGGLLVALVIRYTSNLAKSYAVSLTVFLTSAISYLWLGSSGSNFSLVWFIAAAVVLVSVVLYVHESSVGAAEKAVEKADKPVVASTAVQMHVVHKDSN